MSRATQVEIASFVASGTFAVVGVSQNPRKFGNTLYKELRKHNKQVFAIHPNADEIGGDKCFKDFSTLPQKADAAVICTKPANTLNAVKAAIEAGITKLWLQQGAESEEAIQFAKTKGATVISKECLLMFLEPAGFPHNVHKCLWRWLGKLPK